MHRADKHQTWLQKSREARRGLSRCRGISRCPKAGGQCSLVTLYPEDYAVGGHMFSPRLHPGMTVAETRLFTVVGVVGSRRPLLLRTITWGTERRFKRRTRPELFAASCSYRRLDRPPVNSCFSATFLLHARRCTRIRQPCAGQWLGCEGLCQSYPFVSL